MAGFFGSLMIFMLIGMIASARRWPVYGWLHLAFLAAIIAGIVAFATLNMLGLVIFAVVLFVAGGGWIGWTAGGILGLALRAAGRLFRRRSTLAAA
jgi:hypothetical protein